jgi:hypothetical protein
LVALTKIDVYWLLMIKFLDIQSELEHYRRMLGGRGPVETRVGDDTGNEHPAFRHLDALEEVILVLGVARRLIVGPE